MNRITQSRKISISHILGMEDVMRVQDPDIFQTSGKQPRYYIRPFIDTFDSEGNAIKRQVRIYLGRVSEMKKREAIGKKNEVMTRINKSQVVLQAQLQFGELLDYYLKEFVRNPGKLAASTREKYENHITNHIRPAWQDIRLSEIRGLEIDRWLTEKGKPRVRNGKVVAGLSWSTRTDLRNILSGIFTKAIDWGLWKAENPVARVSVGKRRDVRQPQKLTVEQTRALLAAVPVDVRMICEVALFCTLRISEALGLQWKHLDFERGVIQVRQRFYRGDLDCTKSPKSSRDVPMGDLGPALRAAAGEPNEFVFSVATHASREKKPRVCRDDRSINQHFLRPAAKALGIYWLGFGFHAFRREAVTELGAISGALAVQRMAGHSTTDMSLHYTLANREADTAAVLKFQRKIVPIRTRNKPDSDSTTRARAAK